MSDTAPIFKLADDATGEQIRQLDAYVRMGALVPVTPPAAGAYLQWVIPGEVPEYAPVSGVTDDE